MAVNQKAVKMIVPRKKLFGFFQEPQSSTEISSEKKMISPPMVGVPSLCRGDMSPKSRARSRKLSW